MVLEELDHAKERCAKIYAELIDYKINSDAYNIVQINPNGEKITELLDSLQRDRRIDYLNAHGTGTELNDQIEKECFWGCRLLP